MRKTIIVILVTLMVFLAFFIISGGYLSKTANFNPQSGIRIESNPPSRVFINDQEVGITPFQKPPIDTSDDRMLSGNYLIKLQSEKGSWEKYVTLYPGTRTVIIREIGKDKVSSSGEVVTLETGQGVLILSDPEQANVEVDGKFFGKTPVLIKDLNLGDHQFSIKKEGFLPRTIKSSLTNGYRFNLSVDLAKIQTNLDSNTPIIQVLKKVKIIGTTNGFLRVRKTPSLSGIEIARLNEGEIVEVTEDLTAWKKIKLEDGPEGYISKQFVEEIAY